MKFKIILCTMMLLLSYTCVYAISVNIFDDFENNTINANPINWNIYEKNEMGSQVFVESDEGNKFIRCLTSVVNSNSDAAYFYSQPITVNGIITLKFRFKSNSNADFNILLRSSKSSGGNYEKYFSMLSYSNKKLSYMEEISTDGIGSAWVDVKIIIEKANDNIKLYVNDVFKKQVLISSKWALFELEQSTVRFQLNKAFGVASNYLDIDDVLLFTGQPDGKFVAQSSGASNISLSGYPYKADYLDNGLNIVDFNYINMTNDDKTVLPVLALYSNNRLKDIKILNQVLVKSSSIKKISETMQFKNFERNDFLKILSVGDLQNITSTCSPEILKVRACPIPNEQTVYNTYIQNIAGKSFPRFLINDSQVTELIGRINSDTVLKSWYDKLKVTAQALIDSNKIPNDQRSDGLTMDCDWPLREEIPLLGIMYLVNKTSNPQFAEACATQAINGMMAVADFPNWNHEKVFLNAASIGLTMSTGYDMFHDKLTEVQRKKIRDALMKNLLLPGIESYKGASYGYFATWDSNWNLVCNAGLMSAALTIGYEQGYEDICREVMYRSLISVQYCLPRFLPDGAWWEGIVYWQYAMMHMVIFFEGLYNNMGTDFGLFEQFGVEKTGIYPIIGTGNKYAFNFHDASSGDVSINAPEIYWFANKTNNQSAGAFRYGKMQSDSSNYAPKIRDLLWYRSEFKNSTLNLPNDTYVRDAEVAFLRKDFSETSSFLAFHAGYNNVPHGQLDMGTFVFDTMGYRWASDLGADNYNLYGYFFVDDYRWWYYRNRAEGHNVIVINPQDCYAYDQELAADSVINTFKQGENEAFSITNTTQGYSRFVNESKRGVKLTNNKTAMVIRDEINLKSQSDVWWFMHTKASISLSNDKRSAILSATVNGNIKRVWVGITNNSGGGIFEILPALPFATSPNPNNLEYNKNLTPPNPKTQNANSEFQKLAIHSNVSGVYSLEVAIVPLSGGETSPTNIPTPKSLDMWK